MNSKRATIYTIAEELGMSASYVSRALNDYPSISQKTKDLVKKKAKDLNYKHNSQAANLRHGSSKIIGVVVPSITGSFYAQAIAGIEEVCFDFNHNLVVCQSNESYQKECKAIERLIRQSVDCILISVSAATRVTSHLEEVLQNNIKLIQFDRCIHSLNTDKVVLNNKEISAKAVQSLIKQGYKRIAFIGGPQHLEKYKNRKEGYLTTIKKARLPIPYNYIVDDVLSKESTIEIASELLTLPEKPDAFFTVSGMQSLAVLEVARSLNIGVPKDLGIFGFDDETLTELVSPFFSYYFPRLPKEIRFELCRTTKSLFTTCSFAFNKRFALLYAL